jgi:hypothetical protein
MDPSLFPFGPQVAVRLEPGGLPAGGSAVALLLAVDRAWLDLQPYPLPRLEQQLAAAAAGDVQAFGPDAFRVAPGAVRAVFDTLLRRCAGRVFGEGGGDLRARRCTP